jgi:hypothetical protein
MKKQYVLVNFKACIYALVVNSNLDLLNLIISIMNGDDDEIILNGVDIKNRSNGFQLHQEHQANGGVTTVINIMGIGYIGEPKPGSPRYSGIVSEIQNGESIGSLSFYVYMNDLIQAVTRGLYDTLNIIV